MGSRRAKQMANYARLRDEKAARKRQLEIDAGWSGQPRQRSRSEKMDAQSAHGRKKAQLRRQGVTDAPR